MLLIVGAPRSGTTWLHMLLTRSPAIASAFETHLFSGYMRSNFERWRRWVAEDHVMGLHRLMDEAAYFGLLREFAASVLAKVAEDKPGARFILEKTPAHVAFAQDILALFPDAFFIHLIRDPRAVVASLLAASRGWASDISGIGVAEACEIWVRSVQNGQRIASLTGGYAEVQYEEPAARWAGDAAACVRTYRKPCFASANVRNSWRSARSRRFARRAERGRIRRSRSCRLISFAEASQIVGVKT